MLFLAIYGNELSLFDALFISIFSMIIVFLVLLVISFMIDITAKLIGSNKTNQKLLVDNIVNIKTNDDSNLVAIISSAVACMMDKNVDDIVITKIKRVSNNNSSWSEQGIRDNFN